MFFSTSLHISLAIFAAGMAYKLSRWFRVRVAPEARNIPASKRITAALRGILSTLFSRNCFVLLKVLVLDVVFQAWLLRKDWLRWLAHILIYGGFILLLAMHGLEQFTTSSVFPDYYPTLNPFMFLRDLFAAFVLLGIVLVIYRRLFSRGPRPLTTAPDYVVIIALFVIVASGIVLEGTKITSQATYQEMVDEYSGLDETEDARALRALESYWTEAFGVVSDSVQAPFDDQTLKHGERLHEESCANCHSRPQWAFLGYGVAIITQPIASPLDRAHVPTMLWYLHFLACFVGLAWLPFSKFFHIFATPVHLLVSAAMKPDKSDPANMATRQAIELDACTHCGDCTLRCSVAVAYHLIPNPSILPSEKLTALRTMAAGKRLSETQLQVLQEGSHICTDCHRCTDVCPVGINLEALWNSMRAALAQRGYPKLEVWAKDVSAARYDLEKLKNKTLTLTPPQTALSKKPGALGQPTMFSVCFGCQSCTNVCPVVAEFDNPTEAVGLVPHQIMHALALGQADLALGSKMIWDCVTCYLCQEYCPQGVNVTDVLYDLKNAAFKKLGALR